jgi:hypothetical protein
LFVGGLNHYVLKSRPVPLKLRLDPHGIRIETRQGNIRKHTWSDVQEVKENWRRGLQRMELYFKDISEPLYLYEGAMLLTTCNGQSTDTADTLLSDHSKKRSTKAPESLAGFLTFWDRPMKYARVIMEKHIESFKA